MAQMQRISFLSKRLNTMCRHVYLNYAYRSQALHKQDVMTFSTVGSSNFYLFNSSGFKNCTQPIKQFCAVAKNEVLESKETESAKDVQPIKSFSDINFSDSDLIMTFKTLYQVYRAKFNRSPEFADEMQKLVTSNEFKNFCDSLERKLPLLTAQQLRILLNLDNFPIPSSSVLLQKIHHLIIEKINDFSAVEIISIYAKINHLVNNQTPKIKVLKLICEQYFASELFNDIYASKDYNEIAFLCGNDRVPLSVRKKLLTILAKNLRAMHNDITLNSFCRMFGAFRNRELLPCFKPEIYDVLKSRGTEGLTNMQARNILAGLRHLIQHEISYDENFLNSLVEKFLERQIGVITMSELILLFLDLEYLPLPLIKQLEKSIINPEFTVQSRRLIIRLGKILSDAYYHPLGYSGDDSNHIECIKKLESVDFGMTDIRARTKWCFYLTVLGSQKKIKYLNDLFNYLRDTQMSPENEVHSVPTFEAIISLHAFARKNFPDDVIELPESLLNKYYNALKTDSIKSIHETMHKVLNAKPSLEYCTTSMHHFIDFAVLLDQQNKPQEIKIDSDNNSTNRIFNIENIKKPPLSKLVLYQIYRNEVPREFKNTRSLPGTLQLYLQSLEESGRRVILLKEEELKKLHPKNQMTYLAKKIDESLQ